MTAPLLLALLGLLLLPGPAAAEVDCAPYDGLYESRPAIRVLRERPCRLHEIGRLAVPGVAMRLHAPEGVEGAALAARLRAFLPAMDAALGRVGPIRMADLLLLPVPFSGATHGAGAGDAEDDDGEITEAYMHYGADVCTLVLYREAWEASAEALRHTVAHEAFHCVQRLTHPRQYAGVRNDWWTEGSAEWFANLAQGGTGFSDGFIADFDRLSHGTALSDMAYESLVFFFWLSEAYGPEAVLLLAEVMPTGAYGAAELASALPPEAWRDFGWAYLDGAVRFPDGRPVNSAPDQGVLKRLTDGERLHIEAPALALPRVRLAVPPGLWRLSFPRGGARLSTASHDPAAGPPWRRAWMEIGDELSETVGCGEEERQRIVLATAGDGGDLTFDAAVSGREYPCQPCPAGLWVERVEREPDLGGTPVPVPPQLLRQVDARTFRFDIPADRARVEILYDHDGPLLVLAEDGFLEITDPYRLTMEGEDGLVVIRWQERGYRGRWARSGGDGDPARFSRSHRMEKGWTRISADFRASVDDWEETRPVERSEWRYTYACSDDTLTLRLPPPLDQGMPPRIFDALR